MFESVTAVLIGMEPIL